MSEQTVWIWGRHSVLEALRAGTAREVLVAGGRKPAAILALIRGEAVARDIPLREVAPGELERIAPDQNTQGVAARVSQPVVESLSDLAEAAERKGDRAFLLALDQVQDPQNLGALLRTADAAGVHGVVVPERRSAGVSGTVVKVSSGAASHVPVLQVTNFSRALNDLQASGIWVVGLDGASRQSLFSVDLSEPVAIVVGSEDTGLRRLTKQHCDFIVKLPMFGAIGSLNAAVAGSIAMYEVVRQRLHHR
ncbi:MAG: 23S rRNA (guanosine(2251)-2'-O)-methyltransferase RlmB [Chloroflexota bacterium]